RHRRAVSPEWRRKGPGGPTGLQNRPVPPGGGRKVRLLPFSASLVPCQPAKWARLFANTNWANGGLGGTGLSIIPTSFPLSTYRALRVLAVVGAGPRPSEANVGCPRFRR